MAKSTKLDQLGALAVERDDLDEIIRLRLLAVETGVPEARRQLYRGKLERLGKRCLERSDHATALRLYQAALRLAEP